MKTDRAEGGATSYDVAFEIYPDRSEDGFPSLDLPVNHINYSLSVASLNQKLDQRKIYLFYSWSLVVWCDGGKLYSQDDCIIPISCFPTR
jgi:hypothetical protein